MKNTIPTKIDLVKRWEKLLLDGADDAVVQDPSETSRQMSYSTLFQVVREIKAFMAGLNEGKEINHGAEERDV